LPDPFSPSTPILAPGKNDSEMFLRISRSAERPCDADHRVDVLGHGRNRKGERRKAAEITRSPDRYLTAERIARRSRGRLAQRSAPESVARALVVADGLVGVVARAVTRRRILAGRHVQHVHTALRPEFDQAPVFVVPDRSGNLPSSRAGCVLPSVRMSCPKKRRHVAEVEQGQDRRRHRRSARRWCRSAQAGRASVRRSASECGNVERQVRLARGAAQWSATMTNTVFVEPRPGRARSMKSPSAQSVYLTAPSALVPEGMSTRPDG